MRSALCLVVYPLVVLAVAAEAVVEKAEEAVGAVLEKVAEVVQAAVGVEAVEAAVVVAAAEQVVRVIVYFAGAVV